MKLSIFFAAFVAAQAGTIVVPDSHPNYGPQLPVNAVMELPVAVTDLMQQFPQSDYYGFDGLTCYFNPVNPAIHDVCAPKLIPPAVDAPDPLSCYGACASTLQLCSNGCVETPPGFICQYGCIETPLAPACEGGCAETRPFAQTPEPATLLLTGGGLALLGLFSQAFHQRYFATLRAKFLS